MSCDAAATLKRSPVETPMSRSWQTSRYATPSAVRYLHASCLLRTLVFLNGSGSALQRKLDHRHAALATIMP